MKYKIEPSGCCEHKGAVQIRYDFFLMEDDKIPFLARFEYFHAGTPTSEIVARGAAIMQRLLAGGKPSPGPKADVSAMRKVFLKNPSEKTKKACTNKIAELKASYPHVVVPYEIDIQPGGEAP